MNFFGNCGCGNTSSCDLLVYIILIQLLNNCGCGCGNHGMDNCCDQKCGCGIDICTLIVLMLFFGCGNKCCK